MGRHDGRNLYPKPGDGDHTELASLIGPDPDPTEPHPEDHPSNPDLWGHDPFYDTREENGRRRAIVAVVLCVVVTAIIGSVGWMFGTGQADSIEPVWITKTIKPAAQTITESMTLKGQRSTRTAIVPGPKVRVPVPGPTVYRTTTVTPKAPKPKVTVKISKVPGPRVTVTRTVEINTDRCYEIGNDGNMIEIECP